jgi:diaminopimelate decarboxylase
MTRQPPSSSLLDHAEGGPAYVYELDEVRAAYRDLRAALPEPSDIYYSLKANPHPALVEELRRLGCHAEITSAGELRSALEAGFPARECLYTGPAKQPVEVGYAIDHGVRHFSLDSPAQLQMVSDVAGERGAEVGALLRINPDQPVGSTGLAMTGEPSQFGADASWVLSRPTDFAPTKWCDIEGFHLFVGTNIAEPENLLRVFESTIRLTGQLIDAIGHVPAVVDLGGGFAHPFAKAEERPSYTGIRADLAALLDECLPGWRERSPAIAYESGRYLVGSAGTLMCTVRDVKESKGRTFVMLDSGIHHLGGMSGLRRVPRITPTLEPPADADADADAEPVTGTRPATPAEAADEADQPNCDIVGPLCTPLDSWARGVTLEQKPEPGDVVAVPNVGAYGLTGSLIGFLSHDPPPEVVTVGGRPREISQVLLRRQRRRLPS